MLAHATGEHQAGDGAGVLAYTSVHASVDAAFRCAERALLPVLVGAHGYTMTTQQVADAAGNEATGGGVQHGLGRLRTLELIEGKAELRASETLVKGV